MNIKYRISNRFRFTIFVVIAFLIIFSLFMSVFGLNKVSSLTIKEYMDLEVCYGDTLWSIAETYMCDSDDVRQSVHKLCQINNISADELHPGMILKIPVE